MTNDKSEKFRWLFVWIGILTLCGRVIGQKRPPNYSQHDMPVTNFSCRNKIVGGYYADFETDCRMFHICVPVPGIGIRDFRFLCPNDTLFDQENQICDDWYNIDCQLSSIYNDNFDLYRTGANGEIKKVATTNKGIRIPLGPSSTIKPLWWLTDKPKKNQYEDEDDYKRSGNDILRGSYSNNFYAKGNHFRNYANDNFDGTNYRKLNRTDTNEVKKAKTLTRKAADKGTSRKPVQQYHSNSRLITAIANPVFIRQPLLTFNNRITDAEKTAKSRNNNFNSHDTTKREGNLLEATTITDPAFVIHRRINDLNEIDSENHPRVITITDSTVKMAKTNENLRKFTPPKIASSDTTTIRSSETVRVPSTDYLRVIAQTYRQPAISVNNQLRWWLRFTNDEDQRYENAQSIPPNATTPKAQHPIFIVGRLNSISDTSTMVHEMLTRVSSLNNSKPNDINSIVDEKKQLYGNATFNPVHGVADQAQKLTSFADQSIHVKTNEHVISNSTVKNYDQIMQILKSNLSMFAAIGSNSTARNRSQDYDYAYYDNSGGSSDDDEVDMITKDLAKIEKIRNKKQKIKK